VDGGVSGVCVTIGKLDSGGERTKKKRVIKRGGGEKKIIQTT